MTQITRRTALTLFAASGLCAPIQVAYAQEAEGRKTIFIILRGAMDGLAALIPDDPAIGGLRKFTLPDTSDRLDLQNGFRLHPSLSGLHGLYQDGDVGFVHAAATPYRERSHFDGQDFLETLGNASSGDGWLNRVVQAAGGSGLAVGYALPLALRGDGQVTNWSPPVFDGVSDDLLNRLQNLYADQPVLSEPLAVARATQVQSVSMSGQRRGGPAGQYLVASKALGQLMAADGGPDIGMLSFEGWDTHANQAGQLSTRLGGLDAALIGLKNELGEHWGRTAVVICSEFGRTAGENGTRGTDHGTGGLMILAGGAIRGGAVYGDWPGLNTRDLYEGRDLAPANEVVAVLKSILEDHVGISRETLDTRVFDGKSGRINGLIRV
ncbi:MAG: DUF1501 domain-containing protein [Pseudomonadota bacterium]